MNTERLRELVQSIATLAIAAQDALDKDDPAEAAAMVELIGEDMEKAQALINADPVEITPADRGTAAVVRDGSTTDPLRGPGGRVSAWVPVICAALAFAFASPQAQAHGCHHHYDQDKGSWHQHAACK